MTTFEKWSVGLGSVISIGVICGFLINLTASMALSLDQQGRDSKTLHTHVPLIQALHEQQAINTGHIGELQTTVKEDMLSVVYINTTHVIVQAGTQRFKLPIAIADEPQAQAAPRNLE